MIIQSRAEKIYSWLLFLYPKKYRVEYGDLMLQVFRDIESEVRIDKSRYKWVMLWEFILSDFLTSVIKEYVEAIKNFNISISMKRLVMGFGVIFLAFLMYIGYGFFTSPAEPPAFIHRTPEMKYKVLYDGKNYEVELLGYHLPGKSTKHDITYVGKSKVNLEPYIGKTVHIIGRFPLQPSDPTTTMQCIQDKCHQLFKDTNGSTWAVDIDAVTEIK